MLKDTHTAKATTLWAAQEKGDPPMLTDTIPRCVRGRIYHIKRFFGNKSYEYLGIFKGLAKHHNYTDYAFFIIAEECPRFPFSLCNERIEYLMEVPKEEILTEVPQEDILLYVGYEFKSDLYNELLADPSLNLKVKLKRKSRVAKRLRESRLPWKKSAKVAS